MYNYCMVEVRPLQSYILQSGSLLFNYKIKNLIIFIINKKIFIKYLDTF